MLLTLCPPQNREYEESLQNDRIKEEEEHLLRAKSAENETRAEEQKRTEEDGQAKIRHYLREFRDKALYLPTEPIQGISAEQIICTEE